MYKIARNSILGLLIAVFLSISIPVQAQSTSISCQVQITLLQAVIEKLVDQVQQLQDVVIGIGSSVPEADNEEEKEETTAQELFLESKDIQVETVLAPRAIYLEVPIEEIGDPYEVELEITGWLSTGYISRQEILTREYGAAFATDFKSLIFTIDDIPGSREEQKYNYRLEYLTNLGNEAVLTGSVSIDPSGF